MDRARLLDVWRRLKREIVQDVPEELAACEFDCGKTQCLYGAWRTCERRRAYAAAAKQSRRSGAR